MADTQGGTTLPAFPERFQLTPEFQLLVACSWVNHQAQAERILALSGERIDWDEFIELVDRHRVPVLAYTALRRHANERLPIDIREKLKERSNQSRKQALRYAVEMVRLIKMFAGYSIGVIPLKGLILSQRLFGDTGMRQLNDIDLMVRYEDIDFIDRFLGLEGYHRISPGFELTVNQKKYLKTGIHHYEYVHNERCINLEIHWRSFLWTPGQAASLWHSCQPTEWMGLRVNCLDDDTLLLYLCDHGAGHKWFRIKWLSDIAMILAQDRPNGWDNLLAMANRLDLRRVLAQTALLVHWLYGSLLPRPLNRLIEEETTSLTLASAAITAILSSEVDHATGGRRFEYVKRTKYLMRLKPALPYGMVLKGILISPQDIKAIPLPSGLFWFYIPLRPVFWVWRNYLRK